MPSRWPTRSGPSPAQCSRPLDSIQRRAFTHLQRRDGQFQPQANRFECRIEDGAVRLGTRHFANLAPLVADGPALAFIRAHELALAPADTPGGLPAQA